jgi:hypothetical protein
MVNLKNIVLRLPVTLSWLRERESTKHHMVQEYGSHNDFFVVRS